MVRKVKSECSETRIVLSGHYQGCSVVHQAAEELSSEEVSSVVVKLSFSMRRIKLWLMKSLA